MITVADILALPAFEQVQPLVLCEGAELREVHNVGILDCAPDKDGGYECGFDWFNYQHESVHIERVYPELWSWLTTDSTYTFSEFYDGFEAPKNA